VTLAFAGVVDAGEDQAMASMFPAIRVSLNMTTAHLGTITSLGKIMEMIFGPIWGVLADRYSRKRILIIGAGPIVIGQACEFDYSGAQACKALREEGYRVILVNSNPATIMTDPEMADVTYIEPITCKQLNASSIKNVRMRSCRPWVARLR